MLSYKRKGFKRTFVLVLTTALLVAGGAVMYWWQVSHRLDQDARVILEEVGKELAENVSTTILAQQKILTTLAVSLQDDPVLKQPDELISYLQDQDVQSLFDLTGFSYPDGRTVFSNGIRQKNFLTPQLTAAVKEKNFAVVFQASHPFRPGEKYLLLASAVRNKREPGGIVFALQPVSLYQPALEDFLLTDTSLSLVIDQQGNVLMSHPKASRDNTFEVLDESVPDKRFSKENMYRNIKEGKGGILGYIYDGKQRFLSYYPVGYNDWYAIAILPEVSVAQKIKSLVFMSLVWCISVIGVLILLLTFILRQHHKNTKELYKMGFTDALLGTDNLNGFRLKFPDALEKARQENSPLALTVVNINQFKAINDMYGFEQGDRVLKQVADCLQKELQAAELFCRISSDIFLLLLACPDPETLGKRVEKMLENAGHGCRIEQQQVHLRLTGGIYILEAAIPFYIMLDRANLAAASAKQRAGSRYAFYESEALRRLVTEKRIESDMERALQDGEFKLYLQPKCDFKTGRIVSAEALVRWQHAAQGMIRPDWFIPVFEKNGFVVPLDWYMFRQVLQTLKKWTDAKMPVVPVGVNFSRLHLEEADFIGKMVQLTDEIGVPRRLVEIELTESVVCGNLERMKGVVDELHAAGFSVAMDDFGAGYSSLNVLKNLDFDCVKLDKEFLAKGEGNPRQRQVISGLVRMVKELGCRVVAEGVETQEQADFLREIGCDMAQGFLYFRPLPAAEFEKKLREDAE